MQVHAASRSVGTTMSPIAKMVAALHLTRDAVVALAPHLILVAVVLNGASDDRPQCQICHKFGHEAHKCWKRFNRSYVAEEKVQAAAMSYDVDTVWYTDNRDMDHITRDLDKLTTKEKYPGQEHVHTANGSGMTIKHAGHSSVFAPTRTLHLNNILHVPQATKNLLSIHHFTTDNNIYLEYHQSIFLVRDPVTRQTLLREKCKGISICFPHFFGQMCFVQLSLALLDGIVGLAILRLLLLVVSLGVMNYLVLWSLHLVKCVMHVTVQRVISYHFLSQLASLRLL